jgi:pyridoxamine 5'-phosphate oxidase
LPGVSELQNRPLDLADLAPHPLALFGRWFEEARDRGVFEPEAVALATATAAGAPSARMVLMKGFDERGVAFFTNHGSRKGGELSENPRAALLFHWPELGRQVRIEGDVARVERAEVEAYAHSRARLSQLSALASPQSRPVPDRAWLETRVAELDRRHAGEELPVSDDWGGYRVAPAAWEFWQHRENRLHDRFRYEPSPTGWTITRLAP